MPLLDAAKAAGAADTDAGNTLHKVDHFFCGQLGDESVQACALFCHIQKGNGLFRHICQREGFGKEFLGTGGQLHGI